jgi:hypothetical protein
LGGKLDIGRGKMSGTIIELLIPRRQTKQIALC